MIEKKRLYLQFKHQNQTNSNLTRTISLSIHESIFPSHLQVNTQQNNNKTFMLLERCLKINQKSLTQCETLKIIQQRFS